MRVLSVLWLIPAFAAAAEPTSRDWYQAIREDKTAALKAMASSKAAVNAGDARGTTPLMHAAAIGSVGAVKTLLEAGADVNARNGLDVTALIYGAADAAKARLLIEAGANVNAQSKIGRTPLILAAGSPGGSGTVKLLLSRGADSRAKDGSGSTALIEAARIDDLESMGAILAQGVEIDAGDRLGFTALLYAAARGNATAVKMLLAKGAHPNVSYEKSNMVRNGPIALTKLTPLMMASMSTPEAIQLLIDAGANVNARDGRGMTPLMFAAATERPNVAILRMLLKAGAEQSVQSGAHETARDWAAKFNQPEVMKLLGATRAAEAKATSAASKNSDVRAAVVRSVALLQATSTEYFKQSGCVGCHHQPLVGTAVERAAKGGVAVDEAARKAQAAVVRTEQLSTRDLILQGAFISVDGLAYSVQHFSEASYPADEVTDALAAAIAAQQKADGSWFGAAVVRPPMEDSTWVRTAMAAMALAKYPIPARRGEFEERVARARRWLAESKPDVPYERSFQLLGLVWSGAGAGEVNRVAGEVRRLQREDGGWAQLEQLSSDAYATSVALYALERAGMAAKDNASRRAVEYLLRTQQPDGSWHVSSRAPKLQPYFQSGFPYDHDQWISAAATGWAAAALSDMLPPAKPVAAAR